MLDINKLAFNSQGLIPAIIQEYKSKEVLMLAYMNEESLIKTLETETTWFWSRSRGKLWNKGETSGAYQKVVEIIHDCDADALLVMVEQRDHACHTGAYSCFSKRIYRDEGFGEESVLQQLYGIIGNRYENTVDDSYTCYLFNHGLDKILKKFGEEATEVIIAAKNNSKEELMNEVADLIYHLLVLLVKKSVALKDVYCQLEGRMKKQ